jgi:hypothetical protein
VRLPDQLDQRGPLGGEPRPWIAPHDVPGQQLPPRRRAARRTWVHEGSSELDRADVLISQPAKATTERLRLPVPAQALSGEVPQQVMQPVADQPGRVHPGDVDQRRVGELL